MNERTIVTILTLIIALGAYIYLVQHYPERKNSVGLSTLILTGLLLYYYHVYIFNPSHGITILILPLATFWLSWRQKNTGKPNFPAWGLIAIQVLFCLLYVLMVYLQEN